MKQAKDKFEIGDTITDGKRKARVLSKDNTYYVLERISGYAIGIGYSSKNEKIVIESIFNHISKLEKSME
jgi:hypothetical protein